MSRMTILPAALLLTILQYALPASAQDTEVRTCYWPSGNSTATTNNSFRSCDVNGPNGVSHCCNEGEVCLSNGLCFGATIGLEYRGACTDQSWTQNTTACPRYCTEDATWANMLACDGSPQIWCKNPNSNADYCTSGNGGELYDYMPGSIMFVVNSTGAASTATASASGSAAAQSCAGAADASSSSCVAPAVPIGVGVGVGVPLLLACLTLGFLLWRERKHRSSGGGYEAAAATAAYTTESKNHSHFSGVSSPAPAYAPAAAAVPEGPSAREELEQARKMHQQRAASQQPLSELESERDRVELDH